MGISARVRGRRRGRPAPFEADYRPCTSFAPIVVNFPAGSASGTTRAVALTLLGDNSIEGAPETIELTLSSVTGSAGIGLSSHSVLIEDSNEATIGFQSSASTTPDESTSNHAVQLS